MMVRPELISASSAPSASPLNTCEMKLGQLIMNGNHSASVKRQTRIYCPFAKKMAPRATLRPAAPGFMFGSGGIAEIAAERIRLLHQAFARHDLDHVVVVFLALHVLLQLAPDNDDGADALVV